MPEPLVVCVATAAASPYMLELASSLIPEFIGDIANVRERLEGLRQRLNVASPDANHDLYGALTDAYWIALLQVVAHEGEIAGIPIVWPESLGSSEAVTKAWRKIRSAFPSGQPVLGLKNQATIAIAEILYRQIIARLGASLQHTPRTMDAVYAEVESLFTRSQTSLWWSELLVAEAKAELQVLLASHLDSAGAPLQPTEGMLQYLSANWFGLFRGALTETIKRNQAVESILNTTLLAEVHSNINDIRTDVKELKAALMTRSGHMSAKLEGSQRHTALQSDIEPHGVVLLNRAITRLCDLLSSRLLRQRRPFDSVVVSGNPGCGATSTVAAALSGLDYPKISISMKAIQLHRDEYLPETGLMRCIADALGPGRASNFDAVWSQYESCFTTASRLRTMTDQTGYKSVRQALRSLVRGKGENRRHTDLMAVLKRSLGNDADIELVLRPQYPLCLALLKDLAAFSGSELVVHLLDMEPSLEAPLLSFMSRLTELQTADLNLLIVVSLEAQPDIYPALRQLDTFHVPAASTSDILSYLRQDGLVLADSQSGQHNLIARLSSGSLNIAQFLRDRPRLTDALMALALNQASSQLTADEAWSFLAFTYEVTPQLLCMAFGTTKEEARLIADEIPDELDGGRRLPVDLAAIALSKLSSLEIHRFSSLVEDVMTGYGASGEQGMPTMRGAITRAFHSAWSTGDLSLVDACLLTNFRSSLSICTHLRNALFRLQSVAIMSERLARGTLKRLLILEKIEEGRADDEDVLDFFSSIAENSTGFSRSQRAIANYQMGQWYFSAREYPEATIALEDAITLDSTYHNAFSLLGVVYGLEKQRAKAIAALSEAIRLDGSYGCAPFNLGALYEQSDELEKAAHWYIAAIECDPHFYEAAYNLSNTLLKLNLISDAAEVAAFAGAIAAEMRIEPLFNIASAIAGSGDLSGAIRLFRYCLDLRKDSRIFYNLGLVYACQGRTDVALPILEQAETVSATDGHRQIGIDANSLRCHVRRGLPCVWPPERPKSPMTVDRVCGLKDDLKGLFSTLRICGLGRGADGILKNIAKVSERSSVTIPTIGKREMSQQIRYARFPSYCGG